MDTLLIDNEEYVRVEPNKFVKRSSLPTAKVAEEPKAEDVKTEVLKAATADVTVKVEEQKDVTAKVEAPNNEAPKNVKAEDELVAIKASMKDIKLVDATKAEDELVAIKASMKDIKLVDETKEGWRLWRALPDLKDVSDDELKQHWEEMVKSKPKPKPLVGFLSAQQEVKKMVHTTEVYLSEKAFDFLEHHYHDSQKGLFVASNGYRLYGGAKWSLEWRSDVLFMDNRFRGNRVNLNLASSNAKNQTTETINKLKEALTELSAAITKGVSLSPEVDLSNMESL